MRLVSRRTMSLIWDPSLALTTGSSTPLEESLVWYSTDQLNTPLLPVCVHTLLVCSPVNLLSFQHPSPHSFLTCTSKHRQFLFVAPNSWSNMFSSTSCTFRLPALCPLLPVLHCNLQSYNHQSINQQASYYLITVTVTLFNLKIAVIGFHCLCLSMCKCSLV